MTAMEQQPAQRDVVEVVPRRLGERAFAPEPPPPPPEVESLRAIPWVFAWSQARISLPA